MHTLGVTAEDAGLNPASNANISTFQPTHYFYPNTLYSFGVQPSAFLNALLKYRQIHDTSSNINRKQYLIQ